MHCRKETLEAGWECSNGHYQRGRFQMQTLGELEAIPYVLGLWYWRRNARRSRRVCQSLSKRLKAEDL